MSRPSGNTYVPLSRTPWCGGSRPLRIVECEGSVSGGGGDRLLEEDAAGGQRVEVRRAGRLPAVDAHAVRAQGVDRDEEDAGALGAAAAHATANRERGRGDGPREGQAESQPPATRHRISSSRAWARSRVAGSSSAAR